MDSQSAEVCSDRSVYLITYSQADLNKVPTREAFAEMFVDAFGQDVVKQWVCGCERHQDGGLHFHLALKLNRMRRWKHVKQYISLRHGVVVNFQAFHTNYYDAYKYVIKEDAEYVTSEGHLLLTNSPQTKKASQKRQSLREAPPQTRVCAPKKSKSDLDLVKFSDIIIENNIHSELELFVLASQQKEAGKTDLYEMVFKMTEKRRSELIRSAWAMHNAVRNKDRLALTTMEILDKARNSECVCSGEWTRGAIETLEWNDIDVSFFIKSVKRALQYGRKKENNIMLIGPADCGKTFVLKPLTNIFNCFISPATGTFAWVGAEKAEIIFLNDLRWSEKLMPWADFLNLTEGLPIHLQAPKTHFAEDILWDKLTPIFATSASRIRRYFSGGELNDRDTKMMDSRWIYFEFTKRVRNPKDIDSCGRCFAKFVLEN